MNLGFIIWLIPPLIYYLVQKKEIGKRKSLQNLGIKKCSWIYYVLGIGLGIGGILISKLIVSFGNINSDLLLHTPGSLGDLPKTFISFTIIFVLIGIPVGFSEELLFRGLLGGIFMRKWKFWWGNSLQAVIFAIFHTLPVLLVTPDTSIFAFAFSFISGFIMGVLYHNSGSIIPSFLMHSLGYPLLLWIF